jgi:hypothetical protein
VQRPGHDYSETFLPVVRLETLRIMLAMSVTDNLAIRQMDIKGAYLNGTLKETVYICQPNGYDDGSGRICQLVKMLYGLKQSGREWNIELDLKLNKHGDNCLCSDPCAYCNRVEENVQVITIWVDDLLLFASSNQLCDEMKKELRSEWELTDLGEPAKIVGIEVTRGDGYVTITQKNYVCKILKHEGMEYTNPVAMPMDPNVKLKPNPNGNNGNQLNSYAHLLGELQYLVNATRPDIACAVNRLAAYTTNPSIQHTSTLK